MSWGEEMDSFYSKQELEALGLSHIGEDVRVSKKCSIYAPEKIWIGDHVRVDDFCILSGKITLRNYIHIAAYCGLFGGEEGIEIEDYSTMSSKGTIYALTDDYSGETMTNPMIDNCYKHVKQEKVTIGRHVIIGTHTSILPGVHIQEGCAIGACSLVNKACESWGIYAGVPAKRIKERSKKLLELEKEMQQKIKGFKEPIQVTQSFLPPFQEYEDKIKIIWQDHWLTNNGPLHQELEEKLKAYLKVENVVLFTNGHIALELAIEALGLTGEVITTPFTFASTTHAIVRNGLTPVFCDINPKDFTIDVSKIESLITEKTSAILPVHVYGNPCDVKKIESIAQKYNLKVIYDAAHVFGVEVDGRGIGQFGDVSMFSLHATKVFNAIEGGVLTFQDKALKERLKLLKNFGIKGEESIESVGMNGKMNEFQAAMGLVNLTHLDQEIQKRKAIIERYKERLGSIEGIYFGEILENIKKNYAYFPIVIDEQKVGIDRNKLHEELKKYNIFTRKYFYPLITEFECYKGKYATNELKLAPYVAERVLTLPVYGKLQLKDVDKIVEIIKIICQGD